MESKDKALLVETYTEAKKFVDELLKPKERSPEYIKLFAEHKKELDEINKEGNHSPWEWSYGLDYLVEFLRFMRDYYKLGENVWGMEQKDEDPKRYKNVPTRLETLEKTLYYYDRWMNVEDDYVKIVEDPNCPGKHLFEYKYGSSKKTYKKLYKEQLKYKTKFFMMLAKHIEDWWD